MMLRRIALALCLPLLISGCFLVPGRFGANVDLRKDGTFTVAYKGEIIVEAPDDITSNDKAKVWDDKMARCYRSGRKEFDEYADLAEPVDDNELNPDADPEQARKPCSNADYGELRVQFETQQSEKAAKKAEESQRMAQLFGFGGDDASNQALAAELMKQDGWKSVEYKGKGVFDVDYSLTGKVGHDYLFPIFPKTDMVIPFIMLRKRADGAVQVTAPALIGGGMRMLGERAKLLGLPDSKEVPKSPRTDGLFTVTTNGEILTNNTADGPTGGGTKTLSWRIAPATDRVPETLIRLK